jgi:ankyrin repeat protein
MHLAAKHGKITRPPINVRSHGPPNKAGWQPMHLAAKHGHVGEVRALLKVRSHAPPAR